MKITEPLLIKTNSAEKCELVIDLLKSEPHSVIERIENNIIYRPCDQSDSCRDVSFDEFIDIYYFDNSAQKENSFKVGDWIFWHSPFGNWTHVDEIIKTDPTGAVITSKGYYLNPKTTDRHKATKKEIKSELIKRAKKEGFVVGVPVNYRGSGVSFEIEEFVYVDAYLPTDALSIQDFWIKTKKPFIALRGKDRAAPLAECTLVKNTLPKINGYDGEYIKDQSIVKYGCSKIPVDMITDFVEYCNKPSLGNGNRTVRGLMLDSGVEITTENAREITKVIREQEN